MNRLEKINKTDLIIGGVIFCVGCPFLAAMPFFVSGGTSSVTSPLSFPRFVVSIAVILGLLLMVAACVPSKNSREEAAPVGTHSSKRNTILYIGILFLYLFLLNYAGFLVSTPIIMLMVAYLLQGRNFKVLVPSSIIFSVTIYYVALKLMKIMLPAGVLFE